MSIARQGFSDFSLIAGGPAHRLQEWLGLIKPGSHGLTRRIALCILLTWLPLLILTAFEGLAIGSRVRIPFLYDFEAYVLFLVAIPLLILTEAVIADHLPRVVAHFTHSRLVAEHDHQAYESALARAVRARNSTLAEVVILGLTVVTAVLNWNEYPFDFSTWRSSVSGSEHTRTLAGWWHLTVGMPLFLFLGWRWLWRLFIWYRFLWRISKFDLQLIPTHPDRAAGLGFLGDAQRLFWIIVVAFSATIAGGLADEVVFSGVPLSSYAFGIAGLVVLVLLVFLAPLLMFTPRMIAAKVKSVHDYSALAIDHHRQFDAKWVQGDNPGGDVVLGSPDISSLGDLGNAYEALDRMRPFPFDPEAVFVLAMATLLPMAPLMLIVYPLGEMLELVWKLMV